jgi:hypothetical protein
LMAMIPTTRAAVASNIAVTSPAVIRSPRLRGVGGGWGDGA